MLSGVYLLFQLMEEIAAKEEEESHKELKDKKETKANEQEVRLYRCVTSFFILLKVWFYAL